MRERGGDGLKMAGRWVVGGVAWWDAPWYILPDFPRLTLRSGPPIWPPDEVEAEPFVREDHAP